MPLYALGEGLLTKYDIKQLLAIHCITKCTASALTLHIRRSGNVVLIVVLIVVLDMVLIVELIMVLVLVLIVVLIAMLIVLLIVVLVMVLIVVLTMVLVLVLIVVLIAMLIVLLIVVLIVVLSGLTCLYCVLTDGAYHILKSALQCTSLNGNVSHLAQHMVKQVFYPGLSKLSKMFLSYYTLKPE